MLEIMPSYGFLYKFLLFIFEICACFSRKNHTLEKRSDVETGMHVFKQDIYHGSYESPQNLYRK
jgi:hypothetical protein